MNELSNYCERLYYFVDCKRKLCSCCLQELSARLIYSVDQKSKPHNFIHIFVKY